MNILKSQRLHIGILGRRNVGKSSLLNFLTEQNISIVSDMAGTTTDPVEKAMELIPIGPVVFIDTAGVDDIGEVGGMRINKTLSAFDRMDIALIVCDYTGINEFEKNIILELEKRNTPFGIIINKNDKEVISEEKLSQIKLYTDKTASINTLDKAYLPIIKNLIAEIVPDGFFEEDKILDDIIKKNDVVVQVMPIDSEAPKGRIILPQVKAIRNLLDIGAISVVVQPDELAKALSDFKNPPKLVITDSQVFKKVSEIVPENISLTSYSILFARLKGNLKTFVKGADKISDLKNGDKVLICESCTHPSSCEDIGRVKLPSLIKKFTGKEISFEVYGGHDFPQNLSDYALIIHCGGCMTNKKEIISRIMKANTAEVPITNYGIAISKCLGILERAVKIFNFD